MLGYSAYHRMWKLSLSEAVVERPPGTYPSRTGGGGGGGGGGEEASAPEPTPPRDLFHNHRLDRRLNLSAARQVLDFMTYEGTAQPYKDSADMSMLASLGLALSPPPAPPPGGAGAGAGAGGGAGAGAGQDTWYVWWRPIQEWANLLDKWIDETGQKGSVLTVWEIHNGDAARGTEFWGMDPDVLSMVLATLVRRGKAQVFGRGKDVGVKFF